MDALVGTICLGVATVVICALAIIRPSFPDEEA